MNRRIYTPSNEDNEEGEGRERSAGEIIEDPEGPVETFNYWTVDKTAGEHPLSPRDDIKDNKAADCWFSPTMVPFWLTLDIELKAISLPSTESQALETHLVDGTEYAMKAK